MKLAKVFDNAQIYKIFQYGISKPGTAEIIRKQVLKPSGVNSVLDFGCGIGYHSEEYANSEYLGIEPLQGCVDKAKDMFSRPRATFIVGDHQTLKSIPDSSFEVIIALGVLHHIDNRTFAEFLREALRILKPGGRLTTFDPVFHPNQTLLSRWVVARDRGEWVRTTEEYLLPVMDSFQGNVSYKIYERLLRIPYDHIHMEARK